MSNKSRISNRFTELIDLSTYDMNRIHFDAPQETEFKQGSTTIKFYRIPIGSKNHGGVGEFVFEIPYFAYCFGVKEFKDQRDDSVTASHTMSLSMMDGENPAAEQTQLIKKMEEFTERVKDHLIATKKLLKKPTLDRGDLKALNPIPQAIDKETGESLNAWYFSPKLMERKMYNRVDGKPAEATDYQLKIDTQFYLDGEFDEKGEAVEVNPADYVGKRFRFKGTIKIKEIYIGARISLKCEVYDGVVQNVDNKRKRLVRLAGPSLMTSKSEHAEQREQEEDDEDVLELGDE
jgi:hypothetical protein